LAEVYTSRFERTAEKINITVPGRMLRRIDACAKAHGEPPWGFLVRAAARVMEETGETGVVDHQALGVAAIPGASWARPAKPADKIKIID